MTIRRRLIPALAPLAATLLSAASAQAGYVETLGLGAQESALGGAVTATVDGPAAWYYNPAGLARVEGDEWLVGLSEITTWSLDQGGSGGGGGDRSPLATRVQLPIAFQSGVDGLVLALGGGVTWGRTWEWGQQSGSLRYSGYESSLMVQTLSPAVGYSLGDTGFHLGATLNVGALRNLEQRQKLGDGFVTELAVERIGLDIPLIRNAVDTANGNDDGKLELSTDREFPTGLPPEQNLDVDFQSIGYHLGIQYAKPGTPVSFGLAYRSEMVVDYEGSARVTFDDDVKRLLNGNPLVVRALGGELADERTRFDYRVTYPQQISIGAAYRPLEELRVSVDMTWTHWSRAWSKERIRFHGDGLLGNDEVEIRRELTDTVAIRVGGEYRVTADVSVQAGFWYDPSPIPKKTIDASTLDSNRLIYSLGATFRDFLYRGADLPQLEGLDLSLLARIIHYRDRSVNPGQSVNLGGTKNRGDTTNDFDLEFSGLALAFGANLGYRF